MASDGGIDAHSALFTQRTGRNEESRRTLPSDDSINFDFQHGDKIQPIFLFSQRIGASTGAPEYVELCTIHAKVILNRLITGLSENLVSMRNVRRAVDSRTLFPEIFLDPRVLHMVRESCEDNRETMADIESNSAGGSQIWILSLFPLTEHIAWSSSFPYMYAMVESFQRSVDAKPSGSTAFYASLLVSFFTFGEFLMAPQWARVSDAIGRKPTLLIGSLGTMLSSAAFGFSRTLSWALVARFLAGSLNPNIGVLKTYVGELVSKEDQARGFSIMSFMSGFGFIIGPVVGGYLAEPTKTFPSLFKDKTIWSEFPFLLPNLLVVICLAVTCILGLLFLHEVHPRFRGQNDAAQRLLTSFWRRKINKEAKRSSSAIPNIETLEQAPLLVAEAEQTKFTYREAFTQQVMLQILSATMMSFEGIAFASLIPTFLASPQPPGHDDDRSFGGGFSLTTSGVSNILLTQAVASVFAQIFVIPQFIRYKGTLSSYRISIAVIVLLYPALPFSLLLPDLYGLLMVMVILWIHALFGGVTYTTTSMMITNNVASPIHLATINGVAASCGCLSKTAGPALIGVLYDQGVRRGNIMIPFCALSVTALLTLSLSWCLCEELEAVKAEDEEPSGNPA